MNSESIWIDLKTISEIKGITTRALRLALNKGKYTSREAVTQGGKTSEILLTSLENEVQEIYKNKYYSQIIQLEAETQLIPMLKPEISQDNFIPETAKTIALARLDLLNEWNSFRIKYKPKQKGDRLFLDLYNSGEYLKTIYELLGKTSRGSLLRWNKLYTDYENWEALAPQYKYTGFNNYKTILTEEQIGIFLKLLLHPNQFNIGKTIKLTTHILERRGFSEIPQPITFRRYAEWFKKNNYDKWVLMREGEKALKDKVEPYIIRDISTIEVGEILVADGHVLNFLVLNPFTGKPCRATLVGFLDWKSGYLAGYYIMLEENIQCIASALRMAIINLDMIPTIVYQDNGRAFKAKYFTESADFTEAGFNGIYQNLGIKPVFAKPYNARAKVIERFFREFQEEFEKLVPSYSGTSIETKPAYLKRNEKFHKELYSRINQGYIPTIEEAIKLVDCWLDYRHSQPCPNVKGKTIKEAFESRERQNIDTSKLDDLMMAYEVKTIHRNGIRFLNTDYYSDALYGLRDRVMVKYSLFDLTKIKIYSTKGEYLCTAKRVTGTHPMAYHMGNVKDMEDFKQKIQKQKRLKNRTLKAVKKFLPKEDIKFLEIQMQEEYIEIIPEPIKIIEQKAVHITEKPVFMNSYERYEWLMKNGCTNQDDKKWLQQYKNTDEYKMIYEE
jgi:putative transposase